MNLTGETLSVLKNFSSINPSIALKKGNTLRTISPQKSVMAIATLNQDLEGDACVYDLSRFLSTLSLFEDPDVAFGEGKFDIKSGRSRVSYTYASESMILTPPDKEITLPSTDVSVEVTWESFDKVMRAAAVLKLPDIAVTSEGSGMSLTALDVSNPSADRFDVALTSDYSDDPFTFVYRAENLKLLPGDYNVEISSKGISKFSSERATYFIAIETTSKY